MQKKIQHSAEGTYFILRDSNIYSGEFGHFSLPKEKIVIRKNSSKTFLLCHRKQNHGRLCSFNCSFLRLFSVLNQFEVYCRCVCMSFKIKSKSFSSVLSDSN